MRKSRFTEEQIAYALRNADGGTPVADVCRQIGISEATFYVWKKKYADLGVAELRQLRQLTEENARLKRLVADLTLDKQILSEVIKKALKPARRKALAHWMNEQFHISARRACKLAQIVRGTWYYRSQARDHSALRMRIRDIANSRPRFGYERITIMLRREGWDVGRKHVHTLYCLEGLQLRMRTKRRKCASLHRGPTPQPTGPNQYWAMDFVHDQLADGRKFRMLTVIDKWSRESITLEIDFALNGGNVVAAFERLAKQRSMPKAITVDNGPEFTSKALDEWVYQHGIQLDFIRPGKPVENGMIESFNGRLRDECLNANAFTSIDDARSKIAAWRTDYNEHRPHGSLGHLTPREFIRQGQANLSRAAAL